MVGWSEGLPTTSEFLELQARFFLLTPLENKTSADCLLGYHVAWLDVHSISSSPSPPSVPQQPAEVALLV